MKTSFWIFANVYGRVFGRRWLSKFHHAVIIVALHGLGYDNGWKPSYTGERWFVTSVLKKLNPRVCIDVGASVGTYSRDLLLYTEAEIYAFEPTPPAFKVLRNLADEHPRLHPQEAAVSNTDGKAVFYLEGERSERNSLSKHGLFNPKEYTVRTITMDSFTKSFSRVDYIKVDTEGFEKEVFEGMQETLRRFEPLAVQFEFNILHLWRGHTLRSLTALLPGYEFYRLLPRGMVRIDPDRFVDNIFMFSNIVALRKRGN